MKILTRETTSANLKSETKRTKIADPFLRRTKQISQKERVQFHVILRDGSGTNFHIASGVQESAGKLTPAFVPPG